MKQRVHENFAAALGLLERDWRTFISYRIRPITMLLSAFFSLTLFYYISRLVKVSSIGSADDYYAFVVVGLIILQVLTSTLYTPPVNLQQELFAGTFERLVTSPFGPVASVCAMLLFPFVQALVTAVVMLAAASALFGLPVEWSTAALALPVAVLGALAFSCFGLALAGVALLVKQAAAGSTWIVAGITLISGFYFPVALLPGWIEWASAVQPFTPTVDLLRHVLVGTPMNGEAWLKVLKVVAFAVVLLPVSLAILSACTRGSRRRATILEY